MTIVMMMPLKVDNSIGNEEARNLKKLKKTTSNLSGILFSFFNPNLQAARVKDVHPDWTDEDIFQVEPFLPILTKSSKFPLSHPLIIFLKSKLYQRPFRRPGGV